nr:acyltransferase domain-containing protein [Schlegelella koreensis]
MLFPGQGSQHADMLRWLRHSPGAAESLVRLEHALGSGWVDRLADAGWMTRNIVAQPLVTGLALAAWSALRPLVPAPAAIAGYSVGELAAFAAAGVFDDAAALHLAATRAALMDACLGVHATGLLSIAAAPAGLIEALCARHQLAVAIRIDIDRAVLGGGVAALDAAEADADAHGASPVRLPIGVASHTPWLAGAVSPWSDALAAVPFDRPRAALICNASGGALHRVDALRRALAEQIATAVEWGRCMESMAERRVRCVLEVGPGSALARIWNARHPQIPARSVDEFQSAEAAAGWVRSTLAAAG